jgi:hypothetical protein
MVFSRNDSMVFSKTILIKNVKGGDGVAKGEPWVLRSALHRFPAENIKVI